MTETQFQMPDPPNGLKRYLWRAPIVIYSLKLGWMFGGRLLLLKHTGRKSGEVRKAVLEVVNHDPHGKWYMVASGFGKESNWYRNILATPSTKITVKTKEYDAFALVLPLEEAKVVLKNYSERNPVVAKSLSSLLGYNLKTLEDFYKLAEYVPIVRFDIQD